MKETVIVGLSGGRDSVALAHYLYTQGTFRLVFAHMNFHLRGSESDRDERFVRELCEERFPETHLLVKGVDTTRYAEEKKISIEMAARELRYAWFEELRKAHEAKCIAVAHHADDQIETVLMNLARGTGGNGLTGMVSFDEERLVWRPFLGKTRKEIDTYIANNALPYVEDSTNRDEDIRRNYIRHTLIPAFEELNPSFRKSFLRSIAIFSEEQTALQELMSEKLDGYFDSHTRSIKLPDSATPLPDLLFRQLLAPHGFNEEQIRSIQLLEGESGKRFRIPGTKTEAETFRGLLFMYDTPLSLKPYSFGLQERQEKYPVENLGEICISSSSSFDLTTEGLRISADHLLGKLILRNAEPNDRFRPFGMRKGSKLLFDFLKEKGIPPVYRPFCPILVSEESNEVIAVIPIEIAESVRVTPLTSRTLSLSLTELSSPLAYLLSFTAHR